MLFLVDAPREEIQSCILENYIRTNIGSTLKCITIKCGHELGDSPNGCKNIVLNGVLEVGIYINELEGFVQKAKEHLVCKL